MKKKIAKKAIAKKKVAKKAAPKKASVTAVGRKWKVICPEENRTLKTGLTLAEARSFSDSHNEATNHNSTYTSKQTS